MSREKYGRCEVLYDEETLHDLAVEHESEVAIKEAIKTPAFVYEIRTAIRYWAGGTNDHRCSDRIWDRCEAVDEGNLTLVGDTLKYEEDVNT